MVKAKTVLESNDSCTDDDNFLYKDREGKDCKWISEKKFRRKKKLCENSDILYSCPLSCAKGRNKCPKKFTWSKLNNGCAKYKNGLNCDSNHIFTGCTWNTLQCSVHEKYECCKSEWLLSTMIPEPCSKPFPEDLPLYESCEPCPVVQPADKCSNEKPKNSSNCPQAGLECNYNFMHVGCNLEELKCMAMEFYTCSEDKVWMLAIADPKPCTPPL